jgi:MFS family permease
MRGLIPWNRVVAALAVLQVTAGIIEVDVTLFGAFMRSMGAGSEVLGLVLGLGYGAAVLGSLAGGRLADQVGPRSWLLLCLALVSAGLAVQGASASWLVAALGFLLVQGAQAALRPAALRLLADAAWKQMGSVLGFLSSTYSAVAIGGALLAGWLAQEVGWWAVFLAKAALHLLALVTLAVLLPSPRGKPGGTALRAEGRGWADLLEHAPLRYIYAAAIAGAVLGYAPSFLAYDPRLAGSTLVLAGFASIYNAAWLLGGLARRPAGRPLRPLESRCRRLHSGGARLAPLPLAAGARAAVPSLRSPLPWIGGELVRRATRGGESAPGETGPGGWAAQRAQARRLGSRRRVWGHPLEGGGG